MQTLNTLVAAAEAMQMMAYAPNLLYTPKLNTGRYKLTAKDRKKKTNRIKISKATRRKHRRA